MCYIYIIITYFEAILWPIMKNSTTASWGGWMTPLQFLVADVNDPRHVIQAADMLRAALVRAEEEYLNDPS